MAKKNNGNELFDLSNLEEAKNLLQQINNILKDTKSNADVFMQKNQEMVESYKRLNEISKKSLQLSESDINSRNESFRNQIAYLNSITEKTIDNNKAQQQTTDNINKQTQSVKNLTDEVAKVSEQWNKNASNMNSWDKNAIDKNTSEVNKNIRSLNRFGYNQVNNNTSLSSLGSSIFRRSIKTKAKR